MAKMKKREKKWSFSGNFPYRIGQILKMVATPQKNLKTLEIYFE